MSKSNIFKKISGLNRTLHEPSRLAIMTVLSSCESADFLFLRRVTALSKGNLSSHLSRLEKEKLVNIQKTYEGKKPVTIISLTKAGKKAIKNHWDQLEELKKQSSDWEPEFEKKTPGSDTL